MWVALIPQEKAQNTIMNVFCSFYFLSMTLIFHIRCCWTVSGLWEKENSLIVTNREQLKRWFLANGTVVQCFSLISSCGDGRKKVLNLRTNELLLNDNGISIDQGAM